MVTMNPKTVYRLLFATTVALLSIGTVFYHYVEHFKWVDSYYFSVVTLATVGYGDFVPKTDIDKIFTTFYIFVGVGIFTTFVSISLKRRAELRELRVEKRQANNRK